MTITVKISEAKIRLSELLEKVEAGEEVIIARGKEPIARLVAVNDRRTQIEEAIEAIKAVRSSSKPTTTEEILAWKHEGHRY
jgi:prevent-host-death family protein